MPLILDPSLYRTYIFSLLCVYAFDIKHNVFIVVPSSNLHFYFELQHPYVCSVFLLFHHISINIHRSGFDIYLYICSYYFIDECLRIIMTWNMFVHSWPFKNGLFFKEGEQTEARRIKENEGEITSHHLFESQFCAKDSTKRNGECIEKNKNKLQFLSHLKSASNVHAHVRLQSL